MRIWIITTGEQLPIIDGDNIRLWRSVLLSESLLSKGHNVVRWSSTFDHSRKLQRFDKDTTIDFNSQYRINFIKSPGYTKNVSIKRIIDHIVVARKFKQITKTEEKPDIILCSLPTIELCVEATNYGKKNNIPVVLDGRDMWPDIFKEAFPLRLRGLAKILLYPMHVKLSKACKNATFLSGISEPYIEWELKHANRSRKLLDKSFTHGYNDDIPNQNQIDEAKNYWKQQRVDGNNFNICLFSAMGNVIDMQTIVNAAEILIKTQPKVKFILCGDGEKLDEFKSMAMGITNIIFPGWVNKIQIWTLIRLSKVGILPYWDIDNYKNNIPNKPIEYLSGGLPILSSVSGLVKKLIESNKCGFFYQNGDSISLSEIILDLFNNFETLNELSNNAKLLFEEKFIANKVYDQMAEYLIDVVNEKYE